MGLELRGRSRMASKWKVTIRSASDSSFNICFAVPLHMCIGFLCVADPVCVGSVLHKGDGCTPHRVICCQEMGVPGHVMSDIRPLGLDRDGIVGDRVSVQVASSLGFPSE